MYFLIAWTEDPFLFFIAVMAATIMDKVDGFFTPPAALGFFGVFLAFLAGLLFGDLLLLLDLDRERLLLGLGILVTCYYYVKI